MSTSGEEPEIDPLEKINGVKALTENPEKRSKIIREAMRDVLVSVILLVLTALVTHGDFEKSPASSILASGMSLFSIKLMLKVRLSQNELMKSSIYKK